MSFPEKDMTDKQQNESICRKKDIMVNNEQKQNQDSSFPKPNDFDEETNVKNDENKSSMKDNNKNIPIQHMTPVHRHSMIPISSCRKIYTREAFETPNTKL